MEPVAKYFFDHVHLMSPDPTKTAEFYQRMFGASLVSVKELGNGRVIVNLNLNGTTILVSKSTGAAAQNGLVHFGIRTDNLSEAVAELKTQGVQFTREITPIGPSFKMSFLLAPENVPIELQEGSL